VVWVARIPVINYADHWVTAAAVCGAAGARNRPPLRNLSSQSL